MTKSLPRFKKKLLLFTICILVFSCPQNERIQLPHITNVEAQSLASKKGMYRSYGDIVIFKTEGEYAFEDLLNDPNFLPVKNDRIDLCISVLENDFLYHLHDRASIELVKQIHEIKIDKWLDKIEQNKFNYILMRLNHPYSMEKYISDFTEEYLVKFIGIVQNPTYNDATKKYFIEALYSINYSSKNGNLIHARIGEMNIPQELLEYNNRLFKEYKKYKPIYEKLSTVKTWMDMDQKYNLISTMFQDTNPIMFLQIYDFDNTTIAESLSLSKLQHNAIQLILNNSNPDSFYSSYRYNYLNYLLNARHWDHGYLDKIMDKNQKKEFIDKEESIVLSHVD